MQTTDSTLNKPKLRLIGRDDNAFAILGAAKRAATKAGWTAGQWTAFRMQATSGDYDALLAACMEHFDVR